MTNEIETFKSKVEAYIAKHNITPTGFGKMVLGDPLFVFQLREGREPRVATRNRVLDAMSRARKRQKPPSQKGEVQGVAGEVAE